MAVGMPTIRVLGPVEAEIDGTPVDLGGRQQRAVLARLLVARGEVVSVDRLIDDLWHGEPPPKETGALQAYVSNLRKALEPNRAPRTPATVLISRPPGYAVRDAVVDAERFERQLSDASSEADDAQRQALLTSAIGGWSGGAFAEFAAEPWAVPEVARLEQLRMSARKELVESLLRVGAVQLAAAEATSLTHDEPLREDAWRLLALSLYADSRQADALAALRDARRILAEELGLDPGPELVELEQAILRHDRTLLNSLRPPRTHTVVQHPPPAAPQPHIVVHEPRQAFFGRAGELAELLGAADSVQPNRPAVAFLAGEGGIGKTALLRTLGQELSSRGWRIASGRCAELAGGLPASAVAQVMQTLARDNDPGPWSAALAPLLDQRAVGGQHDAVSAQFRMHRAAAEWISGLTDRPLAILLDDIHRAEAQTRLMLTSIVQQPPAGRLLLVIAYRPDSSAVLADLQAALAGYVRARLTLRGLPPADATKLVNTTANADVDHDLVSALVVRTGGNPFFLEETARLLASEGREAALNRVPEGVAAIVRRRLRRLPDDSVAVLRLAAAVGRTVDVQLLIDASGWTEDRVIDAVEAGVIGGLLVDERPGRVTFSHVLARDAIYNEISMIRRAPLHAALANAIAASQPADVAALAHHAFESMSDESAAEAATFSIAAAQRAEARFAHDTAAELYSQAEQCLLRAQASAHAIVDLLVRRIAALRRSGDDVGAKRERGRAVDIAVRCGDPHLVAAAIASANVPSAFHTRPYGSRDARLIAVMNSVLDGGQLDDRERCLVLTTYVRETSYTGDPRTPEAAREALDLARRSGEPELIGQALIALAEVVLPEFDPLGRDRIREEVRGIAEANDLAVFGLLATLQEAQSAIARVDIDAARKAADEAAAMADKYHLENAVMTTGLLDAALLHITGDLDRAEDRYRSVYERHVARGGATLTLWPVALMTIRHSQNRLGEIVDLLQAVHDGGQKGIDSILALALIDQGRTDEARHLAATDFLDFPRGLFTVLIAAMSAEAYVRLDDVTGVQRAYRALLPHRDQLVGGTVAYTIMPAARALGLAAAYLGRLDEARQHFAVAREICTKCGNKTWIERVERDTAEISL